MVSGLAVEVLQLDQLLKRKVESMGVAVNWSELPLSKLAVQVWPPPGGQVIPLGVLVTLPPVPRPPRSELTSAVIATGILAKLARQVLGASAAMVSGLAVAVLQLDHELNAKLESIGVAVSCTELFLSKLAVQVCAPFGGQLTPVGLLLTLPPVPRPSRLETSAVIATTIFE